MVAVLRTSQENIVRPGFSISTTWYLKILWFCSVQFSSVQFSHLVVSDSLRPHESQHTRLPCPSSIPGVHSDSCPSNRWCYPAISFSVVPFFSCTQSLPASESLPVSFSFSISPSNEHTGLISFRMEWLDLLAVQGTLKSLLQHHSQKHQFFSAQLSSQSNSHIHTWPLEKPRSWLDWPLLAK